MNSIDKTFKNKSVSLVLGSGGARGLAHIGVIKWLNEHNYDIQAITGCSIGSLIGGVYAAGKMDQLEQWMVSLSKMDIVNQLDFSWDKGGLFKGDKIINTLKNLIGEIKIEDLDLPFTAVAADIETEKEVWMSTGSLFDAVRASVSLPLFFTPYDYLGKRLVDGGVLNPIPIAPAFKYNSDLIIAVNLGGDKLSNNTTEPEPKEEISPFQIGFQKIINLILENDSKSPYKDWDMYEVADRAFDTMQGTIARQKLAAYPPDITIEIARDACGTMEFDRSAEMIQLGYNTAQKTLRSHLDI